MIKKVCFKLFFILYNKSTKKIIEYKVSGIVY